MIPLTVATLNLHNRHDRWLARRHLIVSQIIDTVPELISLQEINRPIGQGRWLRNQINNRISGSSRRPYRLIQKRKQHLVHGYFEGIGILSRLPILSYDSVSLGFDGRVALRANIELVSGETVDFVAVHLHHIAHDRQARQEQVMKLMGWLNGPDRVPMQIIAGDFNEVPSGPAVQQMKQRYRSVFDEKRGYEPLATFPTALAHRGDGWAGCLDYIFISKNIHHVAEVGLFCHRPDAEDSTLYPSDHVGLRATLDIADWV